jgi:hypothetical protein
MSSQRFQEIESRLSAIEHRLGMAVAHVQPPPVLAVGEGSSVPPRVESLHVPPLLAVETPSRPKTEPPPALSAHDIIAKWAPRVGAAFATIALVFLGSYLTRFSTPLIRFIELLVASAALIGVGRWIGPKRPEVSRWMEGAGWASLLFSLWAGAVFPPAKVMSLAVATVLQAIVGICWVYQTARVKQDRLLAYASVLLFHFVFALGIGMAPSVGGWTSFVGLPLALFSVAVLVAAKPLVWRDIGNHSLLLSLLVVLMSHLLHTPTNILPFLWSGIGLLAVGFIHDHINREDARAGVGSFALRAAFLAGIAMSPAPAKQGVIIASAFVFTLFAVNVKRPAFADGWLWTSLLAWLLVGTMKAGSLYPLAGILIAILGIAVFKDRPFVGFVAGLGTILAFSVVQCPGLFDVVPAVSRLAHAIVGSTPLSAIPPVLAVVIAIAISQLLQLSAQRYYSDSTDAKSMPVEELVSIVWPTYFLWQVGGPALTISLAVFGISIAATAWLGIWRTPEDMGRPSDSVGPLYLIPATVGVLSYLASHNWTHSTGHFSRELITTLFLIGAAVVAGALFKTSKWVLAPIALALGAWAIGSHATLSPAGYILSVVLAVALCAQATLGQRKLREYPEFLVLGIGFVFAGYHSVSVSPQWLNCVWAFGSVLVATWALHQEEEDEPNAVAPLNAFLLLGLWCFLSALAARYLEGLWTGSTPVSMLVLGLLTLHRLRPAGSPTWPWASLGFALCVALTVTKGGGLVAPAIACTLCVFWLVTLIREATPKMQLVLFGAVSFIFLLLVNQAPQLRPFLSVATAGLVGLHFWAFKIHAHKALLRSSLLLAAGLALRIFLHDMTDTFSRVLAFAVMAVVAFAIGYIFNRRKRDGVTEAPPAAP